MTNDAQNRDVIHTLSEIYNKPVESPSSPDEPRARFTVVTTIRPDNHHKEYKLVKGKLTKINARPLRHGEALRVELTLRELCLCLDKLPPGWTCLMTGVGHKKQLVIGKGPGTVRRAKKVFRHESPVAALIAIDADALHDTVWGGQFETPEAFVKAIWHLLGARPPILVSSSASSYITPSEKHEGLSGLHGFLVIDDITQIGRVLETLHKLACPHGWGVIRIASNGAMFPRSIIDLALRTPNQPIFEGGAVMGKGLKQKRVVQLFEGDPGYPMLRAVDVPVLTEEQEASYRDWLAGNKHRMKAAAAEQQDKWCKEKVKDLPTAQQAAEIAKLKASAGAERCYLEPWFELTMADGKKKTAGDLLAEIKANPESLDREMLPDPIDPGYQDGKLCATIMCGKDQRDGKAKIISLAHGEPHQYYLEPWDDNAPADANRFDDLDADGSGCDGDGCGGGDDEGEGEFPMLLPSALVVFDAEGNPKGVVADSEAAEKITPKFENRYAMDREKNKIWHTWTGFAWEPDATGTNIDRALSKIIKSGTRFGKGFQSANLVNIRTMLEKTGDLILPEEPPTHFLPFKNGLLNTDTGFFTPPAPGNGNTWCLPYNYDASATCPRILAWLRIISEGVKEVMDYYLAMLDVIRRGAGAIDLQKYFYIQGPGGSGKSTFVRLAGELVGAQNICTTRFKELDSNRFETAGLFRKKLAVINDAPSKKTGVSVINGIVGRDYQRFELKGKQQGPGFIYMGTLLITSNVFLETNDTTTGTTRRLITLLFPHEFTEAEHRIFREQGGEAALYAELPGLANLLATRSLEQTLHAIEHPPASVQASIEEGHRNNNPIEDFYIECLLCEDGAEMAMGVIRERLVNGEKILDRADEDCCPAFAMWCKENNIPPMLIKKRDLASRLLEIAKRRGDTIAYKERAGTNRAFGLTGVRLRRIGEGTYNEAYDRDERLRQRFDNLMAEDPAPTQH